MVHKVESNLQSTFNKMIHENKEKEINQNDGPSVQIFSVKKGIFLKILLFDLTLDSFPALVTFTVVAPYGVHTGPTIHTHVHVAFIDI